MTPPGPCPDPVRLKQLLEGTLSDDEQAALSLHLEACAGCRDTIERLVGAETWTQLAGQLSRTEPAAETALQRVMKAAKSDTTMGETLPDEYIGEDELLPFLNPSDDPRHLGRLGNYEILEVVGRGGMGVVFKAFDEALRRVVAVKVMAPQLAAHHRARARFRFEAQAAAAIRDDHVVTIHAVDEANCLPYLVMEYINGSSLQQRLNRYGPLELKEILRIGMQAARGLAAAHAQGLVHRDVKPANILLENSVERVKLTDFGLARAADNADLSSGGILKGTPQYMAPEQALGETVDHRADLFSLGSVLYAMCTGQMPFAARTTMAILKRVAEETPRPVREINPNIPEWLVEIINRLHAKAPADRPQSAAELAALLSHHLAAMQEPGGAAVPPAPVALAALPRRPAAGPVDVGRISNPSSSARTDWKSVLRRPRRLWLVAAALLLLAGLGVTELAGITGVTAYLAGLSSAGATNKEEPPLARRREPLATLQILKAGNVWAVAFAPDGALLATGNQDRTVRLWKKGPDGTWRPDTILREFAEAVRCVAFAPDGKTLAAGSTDGRVRLWRREGDTWHEGPVLETDPVCCVAFAPDGKALATGSGKRPVQVPGQPRIWDPSDGAERATLDGHTLYVAALAFAPDGKTLATAGADGTVRFWDPAAGRHLATLDVCPSELCGLAYSPDGNTLAVASVDKTIRLWQRDGAHWRERATLAGHAGEVRSVAFSPNGKLLASASLDQTVRLWGPAAARELTALHGHGAEVVSVAFAPDGKLLASSGWDGTVKLWDAASWYADVVAAGP